MTKKQKRLFAGVILFILVIIGAGFIWKSNYDAHRTTLLDILSRNVDREDSSCRDALPEGHAIYDELGDDQQKETLFIELGGKSLQLNVDQHSRVSQIALPPITTLLPYRISGETVMDDGTSRRVTGSGVMMPNDYLQTAMNAAQTMGQFYNVWQRLLTQLNTHDAQLTITPTDGRFSAQDIASAEARLGVKLPDNYIELAHQQRAWKVTMQARKPEVFRLFAPAELMSAADWVEKNNGTPEWKTTRPEAWRQLQKEVVFAVSNGKPWTLRYGDAACHDGQPSLDTGYIHYDEFLGEDTDPFDDYFATRGDCSDKTDLRRWQFLMRSALRDALSEEKFTFVDDDTVVEVQRADASSEDEFVLYLSGEWF